MWPVWAVFYLLADAMPIFLERIPLSLYVHIPWCIRKCPYCDFNSHEKRGEINEPSFVRQLLANIDHYQNYLSNRPLSSIFFGGGTPSLLSGEAIAAILNGIKARLPLASTLEVTLEANPGASDYERFKDYRLAGINRLSIGVQSFHQDRLRDLGRIHNPNDATAAIQMAYEAGFSNLNIDLMFGLPNQTLDEALEDLAFALSRKTEHLSWYQLTLEPNTLFYNRPPTLPHEDHIWSMQTEGQAMIAQAGFSHYEVSAYTKPQKECLHNRNYWEFGDYLGIGPGAHSKLTLQDSVMRFSLIKHPRDYLLKKDQQQTCQELQQSDLILEFMLNALRLTNGVPISLFCERTGLISDQILAPRQMAIKRGLLEPDNDFLRPTALGRRFLNDLVALFDSFAR